MAKTKKKINVNTYSIDPHGVKLKANRVKTRGLLIVV